LESLWQKRLLELRAGIEEMSPADLSNAATTDANFNHFTLQKLFLDFAQERKNTLQLLGTFDDQDFNRRILHPRLRQHLTVVDFMQINPYCLCFLWVSIISLALIKLGRYAKKVIPKGNMISSASVQMVIGGLALFVMSYFLDDYSQLTSIKVIKRSPPIVLREL
jgi:hypothetical protein